MVVLLLGWNARIGVRGKAALSRDDHRMRHFHPAAKTLGVAGRPAGGTRAIWLVSRNLNCGLRVIAMVTEIVMAGSSAAVSFVGNCFYVQDFSVNRHQRCSTEVP
jgi:hypothetical protein